MAETYLEKVQREREEFMESLKFDIRAQIVHGNGYHPDKKVGVPVVLKPFPEILNLKQDDGTTKTVVVQNQSEKNTVLGIKHEPAKIVTVKTEDIEQAAPVAVRRGRPPKAKALELPANLE